MRSFGSDNNSAVHPKVMQALIEANTDHAPGYGDDPWTREAVAKVRETFTPDVLPLFVYNGTGSNVVALQLLAKPYNSILCAQTAHIFVDECNAPGKMTGAQILPIATPDGKLTPQLIQPCLTGFGFEHHSQPGAIYISNTTELGTVYTPQETKAIADLAHSYGMKLHVDGARIANAAASLGVSIKELTQDCGVDSLTLGGTKNGIMFGECVVLFDKSLFNDAKYVCKQSAQLASKMRYISAQFSAYLTDSLWLECATRANAMAALLAEELQKLPCVKMTQKVQSNQLFMILPASLAQRLQEEYFFYYWDESRSEVRFVTSFDTTRGDIDSLVGRIRELAGISQK